MKPRTLILLLILFFGGLVGLWWADYAKIPTARQRERMMGRVLPELVELRPLDVRRVELTGDPAGRLVFVRRDQGGWQMLEPVDAAADASRLESLIQNMIALQPMPGAGPIAAPAGRFGLDHPVRTIAFYGSETSRPIAALDVGKTVGQERYVRRRGQQGIDVVDARWFNAIEQPPAAWREKALLTLPTFEVETVAVKSPERSVQARRSEGRWRLLQPVQAAADPNKIEGLIADLTALRVADGTQGYVADNVRDLARYGLDKPRWSFELTPPSRAGQAQTLQVGRPAPDRPDRAYARRTDQDDVVLVDSRLLDKINIQPSALRSRQIADLDLHAVDFIEVQGRSETHRLARGPEGWQVKSPAPGRADAKLVSQLLRQLSEAQTSEFLTPQQVTDPKLDPPLFRIKVWQHGQAAGRAGEASTTAAEPTGKPALDLQIGRHDPIAKVLFARNEGDATILTVPEALGNLLPSGPLSYREQALMSFRPADVARVSIERNGTTYAVEAGPAPNDYPRWRMTKPVSGPVDPEAIARLAVLLAGLRGERLVTEKPESLQMYGLDKPVLSVNWTTRISPRRRGRETAGLPDVADWTLLVGQPAPGARGARFAKFTASPLVFTINPTAIAYLTAELHDRTLLAFPVQDAAHLSLRWPGQTAAFTRSGSSPTGAPEWTPEPGSEALPLPSARIQELLTALANLKAAAFVQYEGPIPQEMALDPPAVAIEVRLSGAGGTRQLRLGRLAAPGARYATSATGAAGPVAVVSDTQWAFWTAPPQGIAPLPANVFAPGPAKTDER